MIDRNCGPGDMNYLEHVRKTTCGLKYQQLSCAFALLYAVMGLQELFFWLFVYFCMFSPQFVLFFVFVCVLQEDKKSKSGRSVNEDRGDDSGDRKKGMFFSWSRNRSFGKGPKKRELTDFNYSQSFSFFPLNSCRLRVFRKENIFLENVSCRTVTFSS